MTIAGLPPEVCEQVLGEITKHPEVKRVVLYGSRAMGRHPRVRMWICAWMPRT